MPFLQEYTMLDELGKGGFATVYKVRHNELGYIRAIRVLNETIVDASSKTYQKFLRECKVLLRLGNGNHPNIVHIYQPRLLDNKALVEMDYVDGQDLTHYLKQNQNFVPVDEVIRMAMQISNALAYCHEDIYRFCMDRDLDNLQDDPNDGSKVLLDDQTRKRLVTKYKIIHNDIHSGNIMRREDGNFVLLDFGLAISGEEVVRSSRHTNGAPEYKAPEKWDDESILTEQSDIYSLGIVLFECLAGQVPFPYDKKISNKTEAEYLLNKAHKNTVPPSIKEVRRMFFERNNEDGKFTKDYPQWLENVILKCLQKNPADRFRNGKELYEFVKENASPKVVVDGLSEDIVAKMERLKESNNELSSEVDTLRGVNKSLNLVLNEKQEVILRMEHALEEAQNQIETLKDKWVNHLQNEQYELDSKVQNGSSKVEDVVALMKDIVFTVSDVSFVMKPVKGGTFKMGSNNGNKDEKPVHSVTVGDFYIGETEVTQSLWKAVMGSNPSYFRGENLPVENVSWKDCQKFIVQLNQLTGKTFRLPTETEWEYAARGGCKSNDCTYAGGNYLPDVGWFTDNSNHSTHKVGSKKPNELGLYDMSGNVWEWCEDRYDSLFYSKDLNWTNPVNYDGYQRVLRGGSWFNFASRCRVTYRNSNRPGYCHGAICGFRLALIHQ